MSRFSVPARFQRDPYRLRRTRHGLLALGTAASAAGLTATAWVGASLTTGILVTGGLVGTLTSFLLLLFVRRNQASSSRGVAAPATTEEEHAPHDPNRPAG